MTSTFADRVRGVTTAVSWKAPCRVASAANLDLTGLPVIDTVQLRDGDRVLVTGQHDETMNGIWEASSLEWHRAPDFDGSYDVSCGTKVTSNFPKPRQWYLASPENPVIGRSRLKWARLFGPQSYYAVATVDELKDLDTSEITAASVNGQVWVWDATVTVEQHQAAPTVFIAPNTLAPGAWVDAYGDTRMGSWANSVIPARFGRYRGGLKIGDAVTDVGNTGASGTWLGEVGLGGPGASWDYMARARVLTMTTNSLIGGTFANRRIGNSTGNPIGLMAVSLNDSPNASNAWALYAEAVAGPTSTSGITGIEFNTVNLQTLGAAGDIRPYGTGTRGMTVLNLAVGGDASIHGASKDISAVTTLRGNGGMAKAGFVFKENVLRRTGSGDTTYAHAFMLPTGYGMTWYAPANAEVFRFYSGITQLARAQQLSFTDTGMRVTRGIETADPMFFVPYVTNSVNYITARASEAGEQVSIEAGGADANIDLRLAPKGNGRLRFDVAVQGSGNMTANLRMPARLGDGTLAYFLLSST